MKWRHFCGCVIWPCLAARCVLPVPPAPLSEKPRSLCHHCPDAAYSKAPGFGASGWWGLSAPPAPQWDPLSYNCMDKHKGDLKIRGSILWQSLTRDFWLHTATPASNTRTYWDRQTQLMLQCLVSWVIAGLWSRFIAETKANVFQHQHQECRALI